MLLSFLALASIGRWTPGKAPTRICTSSQGCRRTNLSGPAGCPLRTGAASKVRCSSRVISRFDPWSVPSLKRPPASKQHTPGEPGRVLRLLLNTCASAAGVHAMQRAGASSEAEKVKEIYRKFSAKDIPGILEMFDDNIKWQAGPPLSRHCGLGSVEEWGTAAENGPSEEISHRWAFAGSRPGPKRGTLCYSLHWQGGSGAVLPQDKNTRGCCFAHSEILWKGIVTISQAHILLAAHHLAA